MLKFSEMIDRMAVGLPRKALNPPSRFDSTERVLIIDGDSMFFSAAYGSEEDLVESQFKLRSKIEEITNEIETWYNITETVIFTGGKDNFRKKIFPRYKAHRPPPIPMIGELRNYAIKELGFLETDGYEADDGIYTAWKACEGNCVIATTDKDMLANMTGIFYSYASKDDVLGKYTYITEEDMRHNFAYLVLLGDNGDGINLSPGIGPKYADKALVKGMTNYQYIKAILTGYRKSWKGDDYSAKEALRMCYKLVKLYDMSKEDIV